MEHDQPWRTAPGVEPSPESDFEFCSDQTFQVGVNHSQKEGRCQTKRSMSPGAENRSRCALLTLSVPATSARCSFPLAIRVQQGARGEDLVCGSAASLHPCHENETLRSRQNQRSASVNFPHISPAPFLWI